MPEPKLAECSEEIDKAIGERAEKQGKKKGQWLLEVALKELQGKNQSGTDPLSKYLVKVEQAKFNLAALKEEGKAEAKRTIELQQFNEVIEKLPSFMEETQKQYPIIQKLAENPTLTPEEKTQFLTLNNDHARIESFFARYSRAIYFDNSRPYSTIKDIQDRFLDEIISPEMLQKLEEYRDNFHTHYDAEAIKQPLKAFLNRILQDYWTQGKRYLKPELWEKLEQMAKRGDTRPTEIEEFILTWWFNDEHSPFNTGLCALDKLGIWHVNSPEMPFSNLPNAGR